jgi:hypothetical protein
VGSPEGGSTTSSVVSGARASVASAGSSGDAHAAKTIDITRRADKANHKDFLDIVNFSFFLM